MSDEPAPTDSPDTRESFVRDDIDEAVTEEAIDHTLDGDAVEATVSREAIETEVMDDVARYSRSPSRRSSTPAMSSAASPSTCDSSTAGEKTTNPGGATGRR